MFQVRLATPADLPLILRMIDEAAEWLRTQDTDQWATPWPSREERDARIVRGLLSARTWIAEDYQVPVGTVTCSPEGDAELWTPAELREPAAYMSRLIVSRKFAGTGAGSQLTDWAGARARAEYGAQSLRIDVWTTNERLHSYYARHGFRFLRVCPDPDYPSGALFSKPTISIPGTAGSLLWEIRPLAAVAA
ncbi:MAG TPA: GNAT family N-acetyltransferase [Streptosporangiaceae bacterium]|nr:GNAT family N-acetyltransferase [Streptosporangiaceae bacterium]